MKLLLVTENHLMIKRRNCLIKENSIAIYELEDVSPIIFFCDDIYQSL